MIQVRLHSEGNFDIEIKDTIPWYKIHKEEDNKRSAKFRKIHPNYQKEYSHTPNGKKIALRHVNKRKRGLGFIPLNEPFAGSVGHHINKEYVVFIPKVLHKSIPHNVWTGRGMVEINTKVFKWFKNPPIPLFHLVIKN
jgi:hypothetical protein